MDHPPAEVREVEVPQAAWEYDEVEVTLRIPAGIGQEVICTIHRTPGGRLQVEDHGDYFGSPIRFVDDRSLLRHVAAIRQRRKGDFRLPPPPDAARLNDLMVVPPLRWSTVRQGDVLWRLTADSRPGTLAIVVDRGGDGYGVEYVDPHDVTHAEPHATVHAAIKAAERHAVKLNRRNWCDEEVRPCSR